MTNVLYASEDISSCIERRWCIYMIFKKIFRSFAVVLSLLISVCSMCLPVSAAGDTCELMIPVSIHDSGGGIPSGTSFTVQISSSDGSPLPEKTSLVVDPSGEYTFGPMILDEPGDYEYTIRELPNSSSEIYTDETVYIVHASAMYNDSGQLVSVFSLTKQGSAAKPTSVRFENMLKKSPVKPPESSVPDSTPPEDNPTTGVRHYGYIYPALLLPILVLIALFGKRRDDTREDPDRPPSERSG